MHPRLRAAVHDLSWLRTRGYGDAAALELVGNRYRLKRRQRNAVARSACSDDERDYRLQRLQPFMALAGRRVEIDGFNVLITVEGALGGAYLFVGRDTAVRDVDPVQGTYRVVEETEAAMDAIGRTLTDARVAEVVWRLDDHVSNVGRVKSRLYASATRHDWSWTVEVQAGVDDALARAEAPVATSDSGILDRAAAWVGLAAVVIERHVPAARLVDLRPRVDL